MVPVNDNQTPVLPPDRSGTGADLSDDAAGTEAWLAAWEALPTAEGEEATAQARSALGAEAAALVRLRQRLARLPLPEVGAGVRDAVLRAAEAEAAEDPLQSWEDARAGTANPWQLLQQRVAALPLPVVDGGVRDSVLREAEAQTALRNVGDDAYLAAVDAARKGQTAPGAPAALAQEARELAALHARLDALPLPEVRPAVRSAVLGAAIESAAALQAADVPVWKRWLSALTQPGPLAVGGLAFALAVAFAIRPDAPPQPQSPDSAVPQAAQEAAAARQDHAAVAVAERPAEQVAGAGAAAPAPAALAAEQAAGAAAEQLAKAEPTAAPLPPRPSRAIAANPASLGPDVAVADKSRAQGAEQVPAQLARNAAPTNLGNEAKVAQVAEADAPVEAPAEAEAYARAAGVAAALPSAEQRADDAARDAVVNDAVQAKLANLRKQAESLPVGSRGAVLDQVEALARVTANKAYLQWVVAARQAEKAAQSQPSAAKPAESKPASAPKAGNGKSQPSSRYGVQPPN